MNNFSKWIKKGVTIVLVMTLLVSSIPINVSAGETETKNRTVVNNNQGLEIWDGTIAASFAGGTGTENDPYQISNGQELAKLANDVNTGKWEKYDGAYFVLTDDIVLNDTTNWEQWDSESPENKWDPIGGASYVAAYIYTTSFLGHLDGRNHTIYGVYVDSSRYYVGLIGYMNNGTVKNLNVRESYIKGGHSGGGPAGGIIGQGYNSTLENLSFTGTVISTGTAGGIIGWYQQYESEKDKDLCIKNCTTYGGLVKGNSYAGGVCGNVGLYDCQVHNLYNNMQVEGDGTVGGVIGCVGQSTSDIFLSELYNYNDVTGNGVKGDSGVGGIIGSYNTKDNVKNSGIKYAYNRGLVKGKAKGMSGVGGIIGRSKCDQLSSGRPFCSQVINEGNVEGEGKGENGVGGILGIGFGMQIENAISKGSVKGESATGGIVGYGANLLRVYYCINLSQIDCDSGGAIAGYLRGQVNYFTAPARAYNSYSLDTSCSCISKSEDKIENCALLTREEMKNSQLFEGFDFENIWIMAADGPELRWQPQMHAPVDINELNKLLINSSADEYLIEQVKKYTSDNEYTQYSCIMKDKNITEEERFRKLNELFSENYGFTDVKEGIHYLSETSAHRRSYLYLTNNEVYCASNFYNWLNSSEGTTARRLLYLDGLIFNYEIFDYMDLSTYSKEEYPGIEKNKKLLQMFMEYEESESEIFNYANSVSEYISKIIQLNHLSKNEEDIGNVMNNIINADSKEEVDKWQRVFVEDYLLPMIKENGEDKLYVSADELSKAFNWSSTILDCFGATADDILALMNMSNQMERYNEYSDFLNTVAYDVEISWEMRLAAYQLLQDMESGYLNSIRDIVSNFIILEKDILYMDTSLLETVAGEGFSKWAGTLKLATFISNMVVDMGDFVEEAAYTQGYAELAQAYSKVLEADKLAFQNRPTSENAWKFFEDYTILWKLRKQGEEMYLDMNNIKVFLFNKTTTANYEMKEAVVNRTLEMLEKCRFELAENLVIPSSVQYESKAVINCPADVTVYTDDGTVIASLEYGVESDITNEYGRFAVVYQPYTNDYSTVVCLSKKKLVKIETTVVDNGLANYEMSDGKEMLAFSNVKVVPGNVIETTNDLTEKEYQVDVEGDGIIDESANFTEKQQDGYVRAENIKIDVDNVNIMCGESVVLGVEITPQNVTNASIKWTSGDESVAVVKNGVVTGVGAGTTTICAEVIDADNVYAVISINVTDPLIEKQTHSVTLGGEIAVNYYVTLAEGVEQPIMKAWMQDNEITEIEGSLQSDGRYKFTYHVAAAQMSENISCIFYGTKNKMETASGKYSYSVQSYAEQALESEKVSEELKTVAVNMLNYGAQCQMFFNYNTDRLANRNLVLYGYSTKIDQDAVNTEVSEIQKTDFNGEILAILTTNTLLMNTQTALRFYMDLSADVDPGQVYLAYRIKDSGSDWAYTGIEQRNGKYFGTINDVATPYINQYYEVCVCMKKDIGYQQISQIKVYSAECYAKKAVEVGDEKLSNVVNSMMMYCHAARKYFKLD